MPFCLHARILSKILRSRNFYFLKNFCCGAPTRIRTWDHLLKRELLYRAELWARQKNNTRNRILFQERLRYFIKFLSQILPEFFWLYARAFSGF